MGKERGRQNRRGKRCRGRRWKKGRWGERERDLKVLPPFTDRFENGGRGHK